MLDVSEKIKQIPESFSIQMNQLAYDKKRNGIDVTLLSLGEAFFDIPQFDFNNIDFTKGYHYTDSAGLPELRTKIADFYNKEYNATVNFEDQILVTTGAKAAVYITMQALLNPGDEVLVLEPAWLNFKEQIRLAGAEPVFIPYDCDISEFPKYFTNKTKVLIINNPNNPSGRVYSHLELALIYKHCQENGIYIFADEVYSAFVADNKFFSMAEIVPDLKGVIITNSLSKNMGLSGWRIGYLLARSEIIREILKLNQHLITCAPSLLQSYAAYYFDKIVAITLPQAKALLKKRDRVASIMDAMGLQYLPGEATFYFLVSIADFRGTSKEFALSLFNKHNITVVPGEAYGKSVSKFIRVGIGTESIARIQAALEKIKDLIYCDAYD